MKAKIPTITIEEINSCDKNIKMNVDIRRLEEHIRNLGQTTFLTDMISTTSFTSKKVAARTI